MADILPVPLSPEKIGDLTIVSGKLRISDSMIEPDTTFDLAPGDYEIWMEIYDYKGDERVARMWAVQPGATPDNQRQVGDSFADTGTQGMCDAVLFKEACGEMSEDDFMDKFEGEIEPDPHCILQPNPSHLGKMIIVASGFGDGFFLVDSLHQGEDHVGYMLTMIKPGTPHPFAKQRVSLFSALRRKSSS